MNALFFKRVLIPALCLYLFTPENLSAQQTDFVSDARASALGNTRNFSYKCTNPAFLSFQEQKLVGISLHNHFGIKELNTVEIFSVLPNKWLDIGISGCEFGYDNYKFYSGQLGISKRLNRYFSLGGNIHYRNENVYHDYSQHISSDLGIYARINKEISAAYLCQYIVSSQAGDQALHSFGLNYSFSSSCTLLIEYASDFIRIQNLIAGIEYELLESFFTRIGIQSEIKQPSFGAGYTISGFTMDVAFQMHPTLGISSIISINYKF